MLRGCVAARRIHVPAAGGDGFLCKSQVGFREGRSWLRMLSRAGRIMNRKCTPSNT